CQRDVDIRSTARLERSAAGRRSIAARAPRESGESPAPGARGSRRRGHREWQDRLRLAARIVGVGEYRGSRARSPARPARRSDRASAPPGVLDQRVQRAGAARDRGPRHPEERARGALSLHARELPHRRIPLEPGRHRARRVARQCTPAAAAAETLRPSRPAWGACARRRRSAHPPRAPLRCPVVSAGRDVPPALDRPGARSGRAELHQPDGEPGRRRPRHVLADLPLVSRRFRNGRRARALPASVPRRGSRADSPRHGGATPQVDGLSVDARARAGGMKQPLTILDPLHPHDPRVPTVAFRHLAALWLQITGTWCNLECTHCLNASGPNDPWLKPLDGESARRAISEAEELGVKEIYFTGGEPFLHREILPLLAAALAVAPTTALTNGTAITEVIADQLAALASRARYSLEIRVSLDDVDPEANDRVRGEGAWAKAVQAIERLHARGLLPIVTATEISSRNGPSSIYERFRAFLAGLGIERPRVKIM